MIWVVEFPSATLALIRMKREPKMVIIENYKKTSLKFCEKKREISVPFGILSTALIRRLDMIPIKGITSGRIIAPVSGLVPPQRRQNDTRN